MLTVTGEIRKVLETGYTSRKTGEQVSQAIVVIEPANQRQNYEVYLNSSQIKRGAIKAWEALRGQVASIEVALYVNHQYSFHKLSAVGEAQPIMEKVNG